MVKNGVQLILQCGLYSGKYGMCSLSCCRCSELTADGQAVIKEQSGEGNSKFFRDVDVLTEE